MPVKKGKSKPILINVFLIVQFFSLRQSLDWEEVEEYSHPSSASALLKHLVEVLSAHSISSRLGSMKGYRAPIFYNIYKEFPAYYTFSEQAD